MYIQNKYIDSVVQVNLSVAKKKMFSLRTRILIHVRAGTRALSHVRVVWLYYQSRTRTTNSWFTDVAFDKCKPAFIYI